MKSIDTNNSITIFTNGRPYSMRKDNPLFAAFSLAVENDNEAQVLAILTGGMTNIVAQVAQASNSGFVVTKDGITWHGKELHGVLVDKIKSLVKKGAKSLANYTLFLENLYNNSDWDCITQLFDFMGYAELPVTEDGCLIAYKGVQESFYSQMGNTETIVTKGVVDSAGSILNEVGAEIEVPRNQVDPNRASCCSRGLHAGSYKYAKDWAGENGHVVAVKINPKDVVSVPKDFQCQKARVCHYWVLNEVVEEIKHSAVKVQGSAVVNNDGRNDPDLVKRITNYVAKKGCVTLREIQSALSGVINLSCSEIENIVRKETNLGIQPEKAISQTRVRRNA